MVLIAVQAGLPGDLKRLARFLASWRARSAVSEASRSFWAALRACGSSDVAQRAMTSWPPSSGASLMTVT
ncbi:hypothetical protein O1Q96_23225 [Streptomyces sp. Qhu-G9]|uniref:hypothetical protein n=1 Tax=Streptomyces sp. Qhu-G9 TaxID=3452799 RepID=UPI0022AC3673|nr:hypothetical protein [Streptomyces aurantiacus]WAU82411.1 hypothetical protein O1Q96_23225 [Streptomyces aurantiacus]